MGMEDLKVDEDDEQVFQAVQQRLIMASAQLCEYVKRGGPVPTPRIMGDFNEKYDGVLSEAQADLAEVERRAREHRYNDAKPRQRADGVHINLKISDRKAFWSRAQYCFKCDKVHTL